MNKLKKFIALYFNLSRKESNGFIFLCFIILIIIFIPTLYKSAFSKKQETLQSDKNALDSLVTFLEKKQGITQASYEIRKTNNSHSKFNPNSTSEEAMTAAGLPSYISKRIVKFRAKGGKFRIKEDLKKIYGVKELNFQKLYSYIDLPEKIDLEPHYQTTNSKAKEFPKKTYIKQSFDINTADSIQLIDLKGIGPAFSSRILKYRKKLGGFISKEQLKEVYGLDSIAYHEINLKTTIATNFIPAKININTLNTSILSPHPYIGKKMAQLIINYHNQHGAYTSFDQLKNIKLMTEENYLKILPYLSLE